jgi:hypothetical protein
MSNDTFTDQPQEPTKDQVVIMLATLNRHVDSLAEVAEKLSNTLEPFTLGFQQKSLMDNVKLYAIVDYCLEVAKEISKIANVCEPQIADRITKRMQQDDMDRIEYSGYSYAPDTKQYINVSAEAKPIVLKWLKSHEAGRELVKEDFNANAFSAFVKKEIEEGKTVHPSVNVFEKPTLNRRKLRSKNV